MDQPRDTRVHAPEPDALGQVAGSASDVSDVPERSRHAVIIGIDRYQDDRIPNLRYAKADAEAMYSVLTNPSFGRFSPANVELLLDAAATAVNIRTAIGTRLPARAGSQDTVLIYYAGHGAPVIQKGRSRDGLEKYLVPTDAVLDNLRATGIPMEDVQKFFGWIESSQVLFFIDSCYSGVAGGRTFARPDYQSRAALTDDFLDQLAGEGRFVVTACDVNEVSLESPEVGHGLFTHYLTEGLKGGADRDKDGLVAVQELYQYVYDNVERHARRLGGRMHPIQKGSVRGTVFLSRYETENQRRAGVLRAEAMAYEATGAFDKAHERWIEVARIEPTDALARARIAELQRLREEEARRRRERTDHIQSALFARYRGGELPQDEYIIAMAAVSKEPETLSEVENEIRHFAGLLTDGEISTPLYLVSIKQARKQRGSTAGDAKAPGGRAPTPPQTRGDAPAPTDSPTGSSPVPPRAPVAQTSPDRMDFGKVAEGKGLASSSRVNNIGGGTPPEGAPQPVEQTGTPGSATAKIDRPDRMTSPIATRVPPLWMLVAVTAAGWAGTGFALDWMRAGDNSPNYVGLATANAFGGLVTGWALGRTIPGFSGWRVLAVGAGWAISAAVLLYPFLPDYPFLPELGVLRFPALGLLAGGIAALLIGSTRASGLKPRVLLWIPAIWACAWLVAWRVLLSVSVGTPGPSFWVSGAVAGTLGGAPMFWLLRRAQRRAPE